MRPRQMPMHPEGRISTGPGGTRLWLLACIAVPIIILAVAGLWIALSGSEPPNEGGLPERAVSQNGPGEFSPAGPIELMVPSIGLKADVGFAPVVDGRLDSRAMRKGPVLIDPEAGPGLVPIGPSGVSLILGHRQWGPRPLVFARLDELSAGDSVLLSRPGRTLVYRVFDVREIKPARVWDTVEDESEKARNSGRSVLILVTCAPYGYNWRRLVVLAERSGR